MSSRATKKRVWRLKNMSNGDWLNMLGKMSSPGRSQLKDWCAIHRIWREFE